MKIIYPGHRFELDHLDGSEKSILQFVQRGPFHEAREGVTNQEVIRAVISRVQTLNMEVAWSGNDQIIKHLRSVIVLHEMRAMLRHVEKHDQQVERIVLGEDGHFRVLYD